MLGKGGYPVRSPTAQARGPGRAPEEATVAALANELGTAPEVVRGLYDEEVAQLRSTAVITNFIEIIAGRRVKERLKKKWHG